MMVAGKKAELEIINLSNILIHSDQVISCFYLLANIVLRLFNYLSKILR